LEYLERIVALPISYIAPVLKPDFSFTETELLENLVGDLEGVWAGVQTLLDGKFNHERDGAPEIRIRSAYLRHCARMVYRYAFDGIFPQDSDEIPDVDAAFLDFAFFCGIARHAAEMYGSAAPGMSEQALATAIVRANLDAQTIGRYPDVVILEPDRANLTLFEVAVLARMTEKSVRNATQPRANDRLRTIRVGTRTLVEPAEALQWLMRRRSFAATHMRED
jgi:hypothetical protein